MSQTFYYGRISTVDGQTIVTQTDEAQALNVDPANVFIDEGVSGYHIPPLDREQWTNLERCLRAGDVLVVRWLDRISRRYDELHTTMRRLMDKGVLVRCTLNGMTFDGRATDAIAKATRDAVLAFMAAQGEADYLNRREMQAKGIAHAKTAGKYKGRSKTIDDAALAQAVANGATWAQVMAEYDVSKSAVARAVRAAKQAA
ncbi:recombinase family protein [Burkholderia sp. 9777_1386]|uniref:recombinase family protein n=1 Tax=Burkholderia sp. 9777_1386 TaxID=2751183 RepID=UPI0018C3C056|nr:recombinase family protein [Burkholderia sp. 9777_1386]MBG0869205.1 recombinase family protein [Burkholderia sp. 9777_1386]